MGEPVLLPSWNIIDNYEAIEVHRMCYELYYNSTFYIWMLLLWTILDSTKMTSQMAVSIGSIIFQLHDYAIEQFLESQKWFNHENAVLVRYRRYIAIKKKSNFSHQIFRE